MKTYRFLGWILFLCCLPASAPAWAGSDPIQFGGWGGISPGVRYLDVADLSDYLDSLDFDTLQPVWPVIGGQGYGLIFERLVVGGRGAMMQQSVNGFPSDMTITSASGEMDIGYAVLNGCYGLAYPFIGLGGGSTTLKFEQYGMAARMLDDVERQMETQGRQAQGDQVYRKDVVIASLGFTYLYPVRFVESASGGGFGAFLPGVTLGAHVQMLETGWRHDGDLERSGPDWSLTGAFLQLEVNFGGGTRKKLDLEP